MLRILIVKLVAISVMCGSLNVTESFFPMQSIQAVGLDFDSTGNAYVSGANYSQLNGNNQNDSQIFKFKIDSSQKLWSPIIGGAGNDYSGQISSSKNKLFVFSGVSYIETYNLVAFGITFGTPTLNFNGCNMTKNGNVSAAVVFVNATSGSCIKMMTLYDQGLNNQTQRFHHVQYQPSTQSLYALYQIRYYGNDSFQSILSQLKINGTFAQNITKNREVFFDAGYIFQSFDIKDQVMALTGSESANSNNSYRWGFAKFNISSWQLIEGPFGHGQYQKDNIYSIRFFGQDAYFAGQTFDVNMSSRIGNGSIAAGVWRSNGEIERLISYGNQLSIDNAALDVQYNPTSKQLFVVGQQISQDGESTQAIILGYDQNFNLIVENIIGNSLQNYAANIVNNSIMLLLSDPSLQQGIAFWRINSVNDSVIQSANINTQSTSTSTIASSIESSIVQTSTIDSNSAGESPSSNFLLPSQTSQSSAISGPNLTLIISGDYQQSLTTSQNNLDKSENKIGPTLEQPWLQIGLAIGGCVLLIIIIGGLLAFAISLRRHRRHKINQIENQNTTTILPTLFNQTNLVFSQIVGQNTTILDQSEMVAIPGFVQMTEGLDYKLNNKLMINEGAQAKILEATIVTFPSGHPYADLQMDKVAAKIYKQGVDQTFHQEVALMWLFRDNQSIVPLIGFDSHNAAILMPVFNLGALDKFVRNQNQFVDQWTLDLVLTIALDIMDSLQVVHKAGITHNDIKSANYLVNYRDVQYHVSLTDFGLSTILREEKAVKGIEWNAFHGKTLAYAAPELLNALFKAPPEYKDRADVYGGSMIINEVLSKQTPWKDIKTFQEFKSILLSGNRPEISPKIVDPGFGLDELIRLIQIGWTQQYGNRPTAREMYESLMTLKMSLQI